MLHPVPTHVLVNVHYGITLWIGHLRVPVPRLLEALLRNPGASTLVVLNTTYRNTRRMSYKGGRESRQRYSLEVLLKTRLTFARSLCFPAGVPNSYFRLLLTSTMGAKVETS